MIAEFKDEVVDLLEDAGITCHVHFPEVWNPPMAWIESGPWERKTVRDYDVMFRLVLAPDLGTNEVWWKNADEFMERVVLALYGEVDVVSFEGPGIVSFGTQEFFGAVITIKFKMDLDDLEGEYNESNG